MIGHHRCVIRLGVACGQIPAEEGIPAPRSDEAVDIHPAAAGYRDGFDRRAAVGDEGYIEAVDFPGGNEYRFFALVEYADTVTLGVGIHRAVGVRPAAEYVALSCFGHGQSKRRAESYFPHNAGFGSRTAGSNGIVAGKIQYAFAAARFAVAAESYSVFLACGDVVFDKEVSAVGAVVVGSEQRSVPVVEISEGIHRPRRRYAYIARNKRHEIVIVKGSTLYRHAHAVAYRYRGIGNLYPFSVKRDIGSYARGKVVSVAGAIFGLIPTAEQIAAPLGYSGIFERGIAYYML